MLVGSGTMEFINKAIKDIVNQQLRHHIKIVKDTFLTHRQIGEAEAYYRLIPSLHLSGSNCTNLFIHIGFISNTNCFLKALTESEACQLPKEKIVTI